MIFDLCRYANVILGPLAFGCLCYRAVIGLHGRVIVYRPLFVLFCGYVLVVALGAPTGLAIGSRTTYLSACILALNVALIITCVFYPGPLKPKD